MLSAHELATRASLGSEPREPVGPYSVASDKEEMGDDGRSNGRSAIGEYGAPTQMAAKEPSPDSVEDAKIRYGHSALRKQMVGDNGEGQ